MLLQRWRGFSIIITDGKTPCQSEAIRPAKPPCRATIVARTVTAKAATSRTPSRTRLGQERCREVESSTRKTSCYALPSNVFIEEIRIHALHFIRLHRRDAEVVLDHQLREPLAVNKNDFR